LRSLVYVSELKLSQILDSAGDRPRWSIATELKISLKLISVTFSNTPEDRSLRSRSRIARLTAAEKFIRNRFAIGDVASGHDWISGQADMGWRLLPDSKTILFCGQVSFGQGGSVLLAMGGSASNVLGYPPSQEQTGSLMPTIVEAVSSRDQPEQFWSDLESAALQVSRVSQPVRFLARVLARHEREGVSEDGRAPRPILLATPLYIENAERPGHTVDAAAVHPVVAPQSPISEPMSRSEHENRQSIGPYKVLRRLGEGSMGIVYLVKDGDDQHRALKTMRPEYARDPGFRQRFESEISTAQRVRDPFVTQVVDASAKTETPYLVTEVIEGPTLLERVSRHGPLPLREAVSLATRTASALAAIHSAGIIHRDLTPSNIILSATGPKVIDFGLSSWAAGQNAAPGGAKASAFRVGMPAYISPEQIQGKEVTPASDIFSWAGTMVYAASGHQPFESTSRTATFLEIFQEKPDLADVPSQLRKILSSALSKTPKDRPTAQAIHRDLSAITWSETPSATRRGRRRRIALGASAALAVIAAAAVPVLLFNASNGHTKASDEHRQAHHPDPQSGMEATGGLQAVLRNPKYMTSSAIFSPDGKSLAAGSFSKTRPYGGAIYLWNVTNHRLTATLTDPDSNGVESLAYSPSGQTLAAGDVNGGVFLWNTATDKLTATLSDPSSRKRGVGAATYSPDGQTLATGYGDGSTDLWNTATNTITATLTDPGSRDVQGAAYAPGGRTLATADANGSTYLWDTATDKLTATLTDPNSKSVYSVAYAPDGQTLATADYNGHVYLWNTATDKLTSTLTDPNSKGVRSAAYAPDGRTLTTADGNGYIYLWDPATDKLIADGTVSHTGTMDSVVYAPGGQTLATGNANGSTDLWRITVTGPTDHP
jgi:serine/threonine protein kinase